MLDRFEIFATTIASINRCVQKIKTQEMQELGLKGTHGMCLYVLGKHPKGLTSTEITKYIKEDKAAISRAIAELMEKGYVYSNYEEEEKRAYRAPILLTKQGEKALVYINSRIDEALDVIGKGLSEEDRKIFYDALTLISKNLSEYIK